MKQSASGMYMVTDKYDGLMDEADLLWSSGGNKDTKGSDVKACNRQEMPHKVYILVNTIS